MNPSRESSATMSVSIRAADKVARRGFTAPWRLYYYRDEFGNFGDDLNPWLWPRLLPDLIHECAGPALVGIGTIMNDQLPSGAKVIVGAGVGYGNVPRLTDEWAVHFVRGPGTARALGLPASYAITDPAHLITQFIRPLPHGKGTVFIPHHVSALRADWRTVARSASMQYVDPGSGALAVVNAIRAAKLVVTSAMHGAILADAFRVPWIRVREYSHLNEFKWQDWGDSLGVDVTGNVLPSLHDKSEQQLSRTVVRVSRAWQRAGRPTRTSPVSVPAIETGPDATERAVSLLQSLNDPSLGTLSADSVLADRVEQLVDAVQQLARRLCPAHIG
jgi:succinoglycan biosynthesis protein ExoV